MKFYSPLRYPGGKAFLASEFGRILDVIGLDRPVYVEPYAGGAGAALALLYANKVERVTINDRDVAIYNFWKAATEQSSAFIQKILTVPLTVAQWKKQREIYLDKNADSFSRGFATFFLNRTNVSGVMNAWPIGGIDQAGKYKIDARFNREGLSARIRKLGEYADRIDIRNDDGIELTKSLLSSPNTFIYLDPPYFKKGAMLYMNHYQASDHEELAQLLNSHIDSHWVLTYDYTNPIRDLYKARPRKRLDLNYRVRGSTNARELMFFSNTTFV